MKLLNDIACNFNWIRVELKLYLIDLRFNWRRRYWMHLSLSVWAPYLLAMPIPRPLRILCLDSL
jgi:hypothetical protein